jgi:hypothetical protein
MGIGLAVGAVMNDEVVDGELADVKGIEAAELQLELADGELADGDGSDGDGSDRDGSEGCGGSGRKTGRCGGFDDAGWTRQKSHAGILDLRRVSGVEAFAEPEFGGSGREVLELAEDGVAELLVEVGRLKGEGVEVDADAASGAGDLFGLA